MQTSLAQTNAVSSAKFFMLLVLAAVLVSGPLTLRYAAAHPEIADHMYARVG